MDKTLHILYQISTYSRYLNTPPPPPPPAPPFQCYQCCYVVKTKSGELQTPGNSIERGGGGGGGWGRGIKYSLPACKSRHSRKMCDIRLFQLLLSMIEDPLHHEYNKRCFIKKTSINKQGNSSLVNLSLRQRRLQLTPKISVSMT